MDITWWQVRSATAGVLCVRLLCFSLVHSFGSFLIQTKKKRENCSIFFSMKMWTTKKFESKKKLNFWWESCRLQHFFVLCILLTWQSHLSPGDDTNDIFFFYQKWNRERITNQNRSTRPSNQVKFDISSVDPLSRRRNKSAHRIPRTDLRSGN